MSMDPGQLAALTGMYENAGSLQAKQIAQKYKIDKASLANQMKIAMMESGDRRASIEATREYQRGQLEQARAEMERIGIPQMEINRFVATNNAEIAKGELAVKQQLAQGQLGDYASQDRYRQGQLQQARDEMLQMGIPKVMVDRFTAESNAAYQRGQLALTRDQMTQIGIPAMLTQKYSAEAQAAYQQGQLGLTQQQQRQQQIEQQRRYALDVAKYGTDLASQPDRYFQAQRFAAMDAPRLLGLAGGAGPEGGPAPGINQLGSLLQRATAGLENQAPDYQLPRFPGQVNYTPPPMSGDPNFPTMPAYNPPPLGALPWSPGAPGAPGGGGYADDRLYAGGSPTFNESTGTYGGGSGGGYADDRLYAGGSPTFNESTGSYGGDSGGRYAENMRYAYGGPSGGATTYGGPTSGGSPSYGGGYQDQMGYIQGGAAGSTYGTDDQRQKQIAAIAKASPPSVYDGLGESDQATLRLMEAIYKKGGQGIQGGELERLGAAQRGFLKSAGSLLGYDESDLVRKYQEYRPQQGAGNLA